jgi:5-methylcytosine-specific restriction endonuclease McrA
VGVAKGGTQEAKATRSRPRLRTSSWPATPVPGPRNRRGNFAKTVPAAGSGVPIREDGPGKGSGPCAASLSFGMGRVPEKSVRGLRQEVAVRNPQRTSTARPIPAPPRSPTEADARRGRPAGGVHGVHRPGDFRREGGLSEVGRGDHLHDGLVPGAPRCSVCGTGYDLVPDHILPRALGGPDVPANLRWLCRRHNSVKGDRIVSDHALRWYHGFQLLDRRLGLGLTPPHLGCVGPEPVLDRLAQFARFRGQSRNA